MKNVFIFLWFIFVLSTVSPFGQTDKGTIKGIVFDPTYGNIIGAIVLVIGTNLGAAVDSNGSYIVRNVPFGQYAIKCSYIGYPPGIDTIKVTKENPEVTLNFELTIPKIPIVMSDSLQHYHNLIATLDVADILEIHIDSVSRYLDYTYLTFTNNSEYPIYLIEDMYCFNTVEEILKDSVGEKMSPNIVNIGCGVLGAIELPKIKNLIIVEPFSSKRFPPVKNNKYRSINSPKVVGTYYLIIK